MRKINMKKNIFITFALIFLVTGCGTTNKAIIETNENKTVQLTSSELIAIYDENKVKFDTLYKSAQIDITNEMESITSSGSVTCVHLKNNWVIANHGNESFNNKIAELKKGDKISFVGSIFSKSGYCTPSKSKEIELNLENYSTLEIIK